RIGDIKAPFSEVPARSPASGITNARQRMALAPAPAPRYSVDNEPVKGFCVAQGNQRRAGNRRHGQAALPGTHRFALRRPATVAWRDLARTAAHRRGDVLGHRPEQAQSAGLSVPRDHRASRSTDQRSRNIASVAPAMIAPSNTSAATTTPPTRTTASTTTSARERGRFNRGRYRPTATSRAEAAPAPP